MIAGQAGAAKAWHTAHAFFNLKISKCDGDSAMKTVSRFEADLLRVLRALLGRAPVEHALPLIASGARRPRCLGRSAVELVQDALSKGCVHWLAHHGGWKRERHLRADKTVNGRLWDRTPVDQLTLQFSRHSLTFLLWLVCTRAAGQRWLPPVEELTPADNLLLLLAHEALRETPAADVTRQLPAFLGNVLCRLAYPQDFTQARPLATTNFLPWTSGLGACILEVFQTHLANCWVRVETDKARIDSWERLQEVGRSQERVLVPFLEAVEQTQRFDLARFVLRAASTLVAHNASRDSWVGGLTDAGPRMAERRTTYRAALAFVQQIDRLQGWERRARGVGYLDEGYAASQLFKSDWEHWHGDDLYARAKTLIAQIDPLAPTGGIEP